MKRLFLGLLTFLLAGCSTLVKDPSNPSLSSSEVLTPEVQVTVTPVSALKPDRDLPLVAKTSQPIRADLPDYGPAPELTNEIWLNIDHPLRLADLRGKVVLIDMWTFG